MGVTKEDLRECDWACGSLDGVPGGPWLGNGARTWVLIVGASNRWECKKNGGGRAGGYRERWWGPGTRGDACCDAAALGRSKRKFNHEAKPNHRTVSNHQYQDDMTLGRQSQGRDLLPSNSNCIPTEVSRKGSSG